MEMTLRPEFTTVPPPTPTTLPLLGEVVVVMVLLEELVASEAPVLGVEDTGNRSGRSSSMS